MTTRRHLMGLGLGAAATSATSLADAARAANDVAPARRAPGSRPGPASGWARGIEGQRIADLGNGRYLNPILAGDYPDPTVLKDGEDYWLTHSSFDATPGLTIWHSRDLVNWTPIGSALQRPLGTVFACDIAKHHGQYFIYIPFMKAPWSSELREPSSIWVIHAPSMRGPWSEPIDLGVAGYIDPGHVVGEDGQRYLFLSGVSRVRLAPDGLATAGEIEHVYDGWRYPEDWVTEAYALEGPKLCRRGDWFYLVSAVGGTSGPATSHMVIVARSRSIHGPWIDCPDNPIVRTRSDREAWWSRGHATLVEGPAGAWYLVYHGYENGFRTLGRQTLLEPVAWSADGWPKALGRDLSSPLPKAGTRGAHGLARSDDFTKPAFGSRWTFHAPSAAELERATFADGGGLVLRGKGRTPNDSSPLVQQVGDRAYEVTVALELIGEAEGGLLLFFNDRLFLGMGIDGRRMTTYSGGKASHWPEPAPATRKLQMRIVNDHHIVTFYYSLDGRTWTRHGVRSETSGYNANTIADLLSLRPALYAAGAGAVRFSNFQYRALP